MVYIQMIQINIGLTQLANLPNLTHVFVVISVEIVDPQWD